MGDQKDELDELLPPHCAHAYLDTWDRHHSIAFSNTKGLRNAPGENNCFVNCAVQVFWHLDVFRRSYRRLTGHTCMGNSCIFCALKVIFTQFQYSDKASLHPEALRKALAETFANQHRFQLGHMDDAAECFENILRRLHFHVASNFNEDKCNAAHCLPHQKFSMAVQERVVCVCGASTNPLKFNEMVHYVSASALIAQSRMNQGQEDSCQTDHFGLLLRRASAMGDTRNCPANCGKQVQKQRTLLNIPDVVSVGLVWDSDRPSVETTTEVARALGTTILLPEMYHHVLPEHSKLPRLQLVAVVCYYGKHYSTFVFHSKLHTWIYFDDATVREIGPVWANVVEKCSRGRFQPLLLLYANHNATPISVDNAPQKRVMAPGYTAGSSEESSSRLNRTHESIKSVTSSSRRSSSTTPNPDHPSQQTASRPQPVHKTHLSSHNAGRDSPARLGRDHIRQPSFLTAVSKERTRQIESGEGGGSLPGGAAYKANGRRPLLDGGANSGSLNTMVEDAADYADYTLSGGDQYRRPASVGVESMKPLPMPPNVARSVDDHQKPRISSSCKDRNGVDIIRYQVDSARAGRGTPDFSQSQAGGQNYCLQKGQPRGRVQPPAHSVAENNVEVSAGGQHMVVRPTASAHAHHDTSSHTPVQSGLATLPRQKGHTHHSKPSVHSHPGLTHREVAQLTQQGHHANSSLDCSLPPGTPPPEYDSVIGDSHISHSRQTSSSSQASSMRSALSMGNLHQLASGKLSDSEQAKNARNEKLSDSDLSHRKVTDMKQCESEKEGVGQRSSQYIDRRMVETILKHQGIHRNGSSCSNSSVESEAIREKLMANRHASTKLSVDIPADTISLGSQKDSGCGSSDHHSASSTGSGSVDSFPPFLFNKSMVIPRSISAHYVQEQQNNQVNKTACDSQGTTAACVSDSNKVMQPIKESSMENLLKSSPTEPLGTQKFILAVPNQPERPPPIPPKNFAKFQIIKSSHGQLPTPHEREASLDSLVSSEGVNSHFVSLCKKADALMDKCMQAECGQDIPSALYCSEGALGCLKEAMAHKELNSKARAYLQKKHSSCLLKVRNLQKRSPASRQESHSSGIGSDVTSSVGNRSSITSSDSDLSDQIHRATKPVSWTAGHPAHRPHHHPHYSIPSTAAEKSRDPSRPSTQSGQGKDGGQSDIEGNQHGQHSTAGTGGSRATLQTHTVGSSHQRTSSNSSSHQTHTMGNSHQRASNNHQTHIVGNNHQRTSSSSSSHQTQNMGNGHQTHATGSSHPRTSNINQTHAASISDERTGSSSSSCQPASHQRLDSTGSSPTPVSHSTNYVSIGSTNGGESSADLYGTLPRNKSRKPGSETVASAEMYQSFLNKQKSLQSEVTSSQQSLDSERSDTGSDQGKMNKSQIRQLLQDSIVQRQWHQPGHGNPSRQPSKQPSSHQHSDLSGDSHNQPSKQGPPNTVQNNPPKQSVHSSSVQQYSHAQKQECRQSNYMSQRPTVVSGNHGQQSQSGHCVLQHKQPPQHPPPPVPQSQPNFSTHTSQHAHNRPSSAPHHPQPAGQLSVSSAQAPSVAPSAHPDPDCVSRPRTPNSQTSANLSTYNQFVKHSSGIPGQGGTEGGKRPIPQNVARVTPYSHLPDTPAPRGSGSSYLVMMPPAHAPPAVPRGTPAHQASAAPHPVTTPSRPLERCASLSDCHRLGSNTTYVSDHGASLFNTASKKSNSPTLQSANSEGHTAKRLQPSSGILSARDGTGSQDPRTVRSLASCFENTDSSTSQTSIPASGLGHKQHSKHRDSTDQGFVTMQRARSKSESYSSKPKSVLKKNRMKSRPRKSVTFAESIARFADCDDANSGYESSGDTISSQLVSSRVKQCVNELKLSNPVTTSDNELDDSSSSNSDDSPLGEEEVCHLCRRRRGSSGQPFCTKCRFYLAKLNLG